MRLGRAPAKAELAFYDSTAKSLVRRDRLIADLSTFATLGMPWARPAERWIDVPYDSVAQFESYEHLRDLVVDGVFLQLGGSGKDAIKALLGGARKSYLVTPVEGEVQLATKLAQHFGVDGHFEALIGTGEQMPVPDASIDAVLSAGCFHHTDVPVALREVRRVLREGGRFAAFDPWHARLYDIGIAIFGKREPGIECRPLNPSRLAELPEVFPYSEIRLHGALTRYPLLALAKFRIRVPMRWVYRVTRIDDRISRPFAVLRRNGSSAAVLATKVRAGDCE